MSAHNGAQITKIALQSLFHATNNSNFELILVDDASEDDTLDVFRWARDVHQNTKIVRFPENRDYSEGVNAILSLAAGNIVFFLSNDYLATPSWLQLLIDALEREDIGIAVGSSNLCDGPFNPHRNLINPDFAFNDTDELFQFAHNIWQALSRRPPFFEPMFVGDAFAVHRRLLNAIGTFDIGYVGYMSDVDFAVRCDRAGMKIATIQAAFAFHAYRANLQLTSNELAEKRRKVRYGRVFRAFNHFLDKFGLTTTIPHWTQETGVPSHLLIKAVTLAKSGLPSDALYIPPRDYEHFVVA